MAPRHHTAPRQAESYTWPLIAIALMTIVQVAIPSHDRLGPPLAVPFVEGLVFIGMAAIAAKPGPVPLSARPWVSALFGLLVIANAANAVHLVIIALDLGGTHSASFTVGRLLVGGALALATNIVTFGLFYWQLDAGGPGRRAIDATRYPDFQFPQTQTSGLAPPNWRPEFFDYLYVAYTNVIAFSPTDTMPLTRRAKGLMTVQSMISGAVFVVVISRVINLLPA